MTSEGGQEINPAFRVLLVSEGFLISVISSLFSNCTAGKTVIVWLRPLMSPVQAQAARTFLPPEQLCLRQILLQVELGPSGITSGYSSPSAS